jgi:hypothetical protein
MNVEVGQIAMQYFLEIFFNMHLELHHIFM